MSDPTLTRRRMAALAGAAAASLAGCTGILNDSSPDEETTESGDGDGTGSGSGGDSDGGPPSDDGDDGDDAGSEAETPAYETATLPSEPTENVTVSMVTADGGTTLRFDPPLVWVKPGGTVTWELDGGNHSATAYHPDTDRPQRIPDDASSFDSAVLSESNPSFEHAFETPGVYDYYCRPHRANGMVGTVVVGTPDPSGQPGLAEPQDELLEAASDSIARLNERTRTLLDGAD